MATIIERHGRFHVKIRMKKGHFSRTFDDRITAELWAKYKEALINEIDAFELNQTNLIRFEDAISLKVESMQKENLDERSVADVSNLKKDFSVFLELFINEISYEDLLAHAMNMLKTPVIKSKALGTTEYPSKKTIQSKFRRLGGVYSNLITKGVNIDNVALRVSQYLSSN